jgi:hypothetical protein
MIKVTTIIALAATVTPAAANQCGAGSNLGTFCLTAPSSVLSPKCEKLWFHLGQVAGATLLCNADATAIQRETSIIKGSGSPMIKLDPESGPIGRGVRQVNAMFHAKGHLAVCGW